LRETGKVSVFKWSMRKKNRSTDRKNHFPQPAVRSDERIENESGTKSETAYVEELGSWNDPNQPKRRARRREPKELSRGKDQLPADQTITGCTKTSTWIQKILWEISASDENDKSKKGTSDGKGKSEAKR